MRVCLLILITVLLGLNQVNGQSTTSGFEILNTSPLPSSQSRSGAAAAYAEGAASAYINPALLIHNTQSSLDLTYSNWVFDANHFFAGGNFIKGKRAFSIGLYSSVNDEFLQRDNPGIPNGSFAITYLSVSGGLAYDLGFISAGITGQYLYEEIFDSQASGYAFNFGLSKSLFDSRITFGSSLLNFGEMDELNVSSTPLPRTFRFGVAADLFSFTHPKNPDLPFSFSITTDLVVPLDRTENIGAQFTEEENYLATGLMVDIAETVVLSAGYRTGNSVRPVSFGAGIITEEINFNYAIIPFNTGYGTVHSIGMQYKF